MNTNDQEGLLIQNSWGINWGKAGFGRLSWAVVQQDVIEADVIDQVFANTPNLSAMTPGALTGIWYDPAYDGSGLYAVMTPVGLIFAYYGWDSAGKRLWLESDPVATPIAPGAAFMVTMRETNGGHFQTPAQPSTLTPWGMLTVNFSTADGSTAVATLAGKDGSVNLDLVKLSGIPNPPQASGIWYDPAYDGSGLFAFMTPAGLAVAYYNWDSAGNRLWLTSNIDQPTQIKAGTRLTLTLSETVGGHFLTPAKPSTLTPWGTLELDFYSCTQAAGTLSGIDGTVKFNNLVMLGSVLNMPPGC